MTPKERVMNMFDRKPIDTLPVFSGLSMLAKPALDEAGYAFSGIHADHERMAWAAIRSSRMLNVDCIVVPFDITMQSETRVDQVVETIKENIDAGVDAVWPGSDLWQDIKPENIRAIVDTVHDYGRKPSPAVGRVG